MLKVGLTGGIGAGKSTVAHIFEVLGIPVYHADQEAKRLMQTNPVLIEKIRMAFSDKAYADGMLDRKFLSSVVFNDKQQLELLNSIVHPFTIQDGKEWMKRQTSPYAIKEAALIFESGSQGEFDSIIGVFAPTTLRIHRTIQRDQVEREKVLHRMEKQLDESIKMKLCDHVLINNEQTLLMPQAIALHQKLLSLSTEAGNKD
ncbi:MAG: dephospho-CoA kinase [bacterium]|jgi:dephospho-CoA kinase|nr:dephospho-CoA kinase [Chitinophagaceae bacterium]